jgi:hypothetical protein
VLVLPLDGSVDVSMRSKLNAQVVRLARKVPGSVSVGDTTFDETAAAVGCDPAAPPCAEIVRSTLGVDELVYGRATSNGSQTTLVVHRVRARAAATEATATLALSGDPDAAEPTLAPLFDSSAHAPAPRVPASPPSTAPTSDTPPVADDEPTLPPPVLPLEGEAHPGRTRGIVLTATGGALFVVGVGLWFSAHGEQSEIDDANPMDAGDFRALEDKEDSAQRNALIGDLLVGAGAGLATWGIITLVRSRTATESIVVAPRVSTSTAGLVLEGPW